MPFGDTRVDAKETTARLLHVLDIPDEYKYMDPELVELLAQSVGHLLNIE